MHVCVCSITKIIGLFAFSVIHRMCSLVTVHIILTGRVDVRVILQITTYVTRFGGGNSISTFAMSNVNSGSCGFPTHVPILEYIGHCKSLSLQWIPKILMAVIFFSLFLTFFLPRNDLTPCTVSTISPTIFPWRYFASLWQFVSTNLSFSIPWHLSPAPSHLATVSFSSVSLNPFLFCSFTRSVL